MAERRFKIAVGVLILVALYAALVPWLADVDDRVTDFSAARLAPSFDHPFGTDSAGRDLFVRIAAGIRTSLLIALACALLATVIGVAVGTTAGL
ncbi:ABC transporter permease, partial [Rhodococcus erythropolis]